MLWHENSCIEKKLNMKKLLILSFVTITFSYCNPSHKSTESTTDSSRSSTSVDANSTRDTSTLRRDTSALPRDTMMRDTSNPHLIKQ
jgi:hypothetical protein